jgi:hypothetical protein
MLTVEQWPIQRLITSISRHIKTELPVDLVRHGHREHPERGAEGAHVSQLVPITLVPGTKPKR